VGLAEGRPVTREVQIMLLCIAATGAVILLLKRLAYLALS
jgi:hypothetical protein